VTNFDCCILARDVPPLKGTDRNTNTSQGGMAMFPLVTGNTDIPPCDVFVKSSGGDEPI
jgi:hypothetical protein